MARRLRLTKYGKLVLVLTVLMLVIIVLGTILTMRSCSSSHGSAVSGQSSDSTLFNAGDDINLESETIYESDGEVGALWHNYLEELVFNEQHQKLYGITLNDYSTQSSEIESGETFSKLLNDKYGVNIAVVNELITKCDGVFDLRDLRAGKPYTAFLREGAQGEGDTLDYLVYEQTKTQYIVFGTGADVCVREERKNVTTEERYAEGVIESSLYATIYKEGLSPDLAHKLSEIYKWSIDFFGIQKGDKFKVLYEENFIDTLSIGIGTIYGAEFTHVGQPYLAVRFEQGEELGYWDAKGKNLRKNFLSAPLSFSARVSSRFGMRIHPIKRTRSQHNGVDYAAPTGTPVLSIADGTVSRKYWDRYGGGNTMWVKHAQGLESGYLHLSRYAKGIAPGVRVRQGQVIAYVGSTGMSTGPHLDYRIKQRGKYINPLKVPSTPTTPIKAPNKAAFASMTSDVMAVMEEYAKAR